MNAFLRGARDGLQTSAGQRQVYTDTALYWWGLAYGLWLAAWAGGRR